MLRRVEQELISKLIEDCYMAGFIDGTHHASKVVKGTADPIQEHELRRAAEIFANMRREGPRNDKAVSSPIEQG